MAVASSQPELTVKPKSLHVSDPILQPFLQPSFDPVEYLNSTLPSLASKTSRPLAAAAAASGNNTNVVSISELSTQTQSLLSQLNALTTRLSNVLTQLTDDVLRSGGRLAYQVEVLRGEAIGLGDALDDTLRADILRFLPSGLPRPTAAATPADEATPGKDQKNVEEASKEASKESSDQASQISTPPKDPATATTTPETVPTYISELRMLTQIRGRLDSIIQLLDSCMKWPLAPSALPLTATLISVSAPQPDGPAGAAMTPERLEETAKRHSDTLRTDLADLILTAPDVSSGQTAALAHIDALRALLPVWKGTVEEKPRAKFVDTMAKFVEDKVKERLEKERDRDRRSSHRKQRSRSGSRVSSRVARSGSGSGTATPSSTSGNTGGGFLEGLQRMRNNYLDRD